MPFFTIGMEIAIYIIIGLAVGAFAVWLILRGQGEKKPETDSLLLIQNQLNALSKTLDDKLGASNKEMQSAVRNQFSESQKLIKDITEKLTRVDEGQKQVANFADQLGELQDILKNP